MKLNKEKLVALFGLFAVALVFGLAMMDPAFAGTDTTFTATVTKLVGWLSGSLGVLISIIALAVAVISAVSGKLTSVVTAVGIALVIQVGPTVLSGMFTATLPA